MITRIRLFLFTLSLAFLSVGFAQEGNTILDKLKKDKQYSTFVKGLEATGLDAALSGKAQMTVFAPTNRAFESKKEFFDEMFKEHNVQMLTRIMASHISKNSLGEKELIQIRAQEESGVKGGEQEEIELKSITGNTYKVETIHDLYKLTSTSDIGKVIITKSDFSSTNGSLHTISKCILIRE